MNLPNKPSQLWTLALSAVLATTAFAQHGTLAESAACCQLTTSLAQDMTRGLDRQGDESFFTQEGAPANVHFLLDTSGSMMELPYVRASNNYEFWVQTTSGCSNPIINAQQTAKGWDGTKFYPPPDQGTGLGTDTGFPNLFQASAASGRYYAYMTWQDDMAPTAQWTTAAAACAVQSYTGTTTQQTTKRNACIACLNTKGYYRNPDYSVPTSSGWENGIWTTSSTYASARNNFIFSGNFLNWNPPKYVSMKKVMKEIIRDLKRVRIGYSTFDSTGNSNGATLRAAQNPTCDAILTNGDAFDANRAAYVNSVNSVAITGGTPLGESIFNIGQLFSSSDTVYTTNFGFDSAYLKSSFRNAALTSQSRSWCWGCQATSVVIMTDGDPSGDSLLSASPGSGKLTAFQRILAANKKAITCPDENGDGQPDCTDGVDDKLDDVTYFLHRQDLQQNNPVIVGDLNTAGSQNITFYGIGFGLSSALLRNAVREEVGGGFYREAYDADELKTAVLEIVSSIETRGTSFAASSVSSLQVNQTGGSIIPRFKPARTGFDKPWQGYLYRFDLGKESTDGCVEADAAKAFADGTEYLLDRNANGTCEDYSLLDKNQKLVMENDDGDFVLSDSPATPAEPYWEAGDVLKNATTKPYVWRNRSIWTVIDNSASPFANDRKYDANDTPIEFTEANAAILRPYLGIGTDPMDCADIATMLDPYATTGMDTTECAKAIIRWVRGADAFSADATARGKDRENLLQDIFHSSPVIVHAPVPAGSEVAIGYQQIQTIYETGYKKPEQTYTPHQQNYTIGSDKGDAWEAWLYDNQQRDKIILVGSNGGMLHAFHSGTVPPTNNIDPTTGLYKHNAGTGEELWAFIPPDLLPRLRKSLNTHAYLMDGSAMVREAWFDTNDDNIKQKDEFRTVAVVNEGIGGSHRFALDLTRLIPKNRVYSRSGVRFQKGDFLWLWPQPCDNMALKVGQSVSEFYPKPPPIGAIRVLDENGVTGPVHGGAEERWVTFLNGGFDQYLTRGRGVAMVDLRTGSTLWSFFYGDGGRANDFRYPTTAAVAMADIGTPANTSSEIDDDLFFDTANIGDYGGTLWTFRFQEPPKLKKDTTGVVSLENPKWWGARAFRTPGSLDGSVRQPFSFMVEQAWQYNPQRLRVLAGTGDRMRMQDTGGPRCRLSNPLACAQLGCVVRNTTSVTRNGVLANVSSENFAAYALNSLSQVNLPSLNSCLSSKATLTWDYDSANGCVNDSAGTVEMTCSTIPGQGFGCRMSQNQWSVLDVAKTAPTASPDRFYSVYVYGEDANRRFDTEATATTYHANPLTETSAKFIKLNDTTKTYASDFDNGWYWSYADTEERTGAMATVVGQAVLWNSFAPTGQAAVCSTMGNNKARLFQANYITGAPNAADSFFSAATKNYLRSKDYTTVALPPAPSPVWSIEGAFSSSGVVLSGPGVSSGHDVSSSNEIFQSVYQLEVDRTEHTCRHEGTCP